MERMRDAYQSAATYRDDGRFVIRSRDASAEILEEAPLAVTLHRPNRFVAKLYQVTLASDGDTFRGKIADAETGNVDGQVLSRPAPESLTIEDVYSDRLVHELVVGGLGSFPVQLELLLSDEPLAPFFAEGAKRRLLEDRTIDDRACAGVAVDTGDGEWVLWIDRENYVLRQFDYPTYSPEFAFSAEFRQAELGGRLDDDFTFDVPDDATIVQQFVPPPPPLASDLIGEQVSDFRFTDLEGGEVSDQSLAGRTVVLVWFMRTPGSLEALKQVSQVRARYKDDDRLSFWAVFIEDSSVSHDELRAFLRNGGVDLPVVRDTQLMGRDRFRIPGAPMVMVLDGDAVMHYAQTQPEPPIGEALSAVLDQMIRGDNLARRILEAYRQAQEQYAGNLQAAAEGRLASIEALPTTAIAQRSDPKRLQLTPLWTCADLASPGNITVIEAVPPGGVDADGGPAAGAAPVDDRILVFDGWRSVVELAADGTVAARHELDLPRDAAVSYLRTFADRQGKRYYAAWELRGRQAYLFNDRWERIVTYPPLDEQHEGIDDVLVADLDRDESGEPELYLGFWGLLGVHAVSLDGTQRWRNRASPTALSLTLTAEDPIEWRKLLVTGDQGDIVRVDHFGGDDRRMAVSDRAIHYLHTARFGQPKSAAYLGISVTDEGRLLAVALNADFEEQWSYPLPRGAFANQIQYVTSGSLFSDTSGSWVLAGPDGSLHVIDDSGDFSDYWNYGRLLKGIGVARIGGKPALVVAADDEVTAWRVELPEKVGQ
jgi:hypothetical protein